MAVRRAGARRPQVSLGRRAGAGRCNGGETGGTTPVKAFPGRPLAVWLLRHVRQRLAMDRERTQRRPDAFCIIRGGSFFAAKGSNWYVDGGPRPANFATKFLLMWPGLDRCSTIGFRCVVDLEPLGNGE